MTASGGVNLFYCIAIQIFRNIEFIEIIKNKGFNEIVVEYTSEVHTIWSDNKLRIIDLHMFKDNCDGTICYEGEVFQKNIFYFNVIENRRVNQLPVLPSLVVSYHF